MLNKYSIGMLALAATAGSALASISTYTSNTSMIGGLTNYADFNNLNNFQSLLNYQEDGLQISADRDYFSWNPPGLDGSEMFYAGTGALELINITLVNGDNFNDIDMQISSGWSPSAIDTVYLWAQLYNNGTLINEFNINAQSGEYVGFTGGGFDQILIGSYASEQIRDSRNPNARNALALDNISAGTVVPAPATLLLPALAMIGIRPRRA
ncbi:MAG: hypothetical protein JKY43_03955 [Phycisphaerales bacterium]|nr:hypothetical protein [Phycisphaerales bacterium]